MLWLLIALLVVALTLVEVLHNRKMKAFKNQMPGPTPLPIIGNGLHALGDSMSFLRVISAFVAKYGLRVRGYLFSELFILFADPKDIEAILSSSDIITKAAEYRYMHKWLGQGLLTAGGLRWRTHRKFLTPAFHFNILQNFMPIFDKNEKILVRKLKLIADGRPIDVFPLVALAALDNISESAMGVSVNAQLDSESEYVKAVKDMSEITFKRMRHPLWRADLIFNRLGARARQDKALRVLHGFTMGVIRNRRTALQLSGATLEDLQNDMGVKKKVAFLDLLLLSKLNGQTLNDETIREEVDTFMFEGHDTTTSAISFALYCISENPNVQETLYREQLDIFGDDKTRTITYSDLTSMNYLDMVIKETLRLYPSVPFIGRQVVDDLHILGLVLPKGTSVIVSMLHAHRHPDVFDDPLAFRPERFLPENCAKRNPYSWVAFSAGPRNCIGQKFAMMEMKAMLSSVIRNFKLESAGVEPELVGDLILRAKNGLLVKFFER